MLSRRDALRGGTASLAAIAAGGAVAGAAATGAVPQLANCQIDNKPEPLIALVNEMDRLDGIIRDIDQRTGDVDDNPDPTLTEADLKALRVTRWQYRDQWQALEDKLVDTPAQSLDGIVAKLRAWYGEDERAEMIAEGEPWDPLPTSYVGSIYRDLERLAGDST